MDRAFVIKTTLTIQAEINSTPSMFRVIRFCTFFYVILFGSFILFDDSRGVSASGATGALQKLRCSSEDCKLMTKLSNPQLSKAKNDFCFRLHSEISDTMDTLNIVLLPDDDEGLYVQKVFFECSMGTWMFLV